MPSYNRLRKAELLQLCVIRNIDYAGCITKADYIDLIQQHEMRNDVVDEINDDVHNTDDDDEVASENDQETGSDELR